MIKLKHHIIGLCCACFITPPWVLAADSVAYQLSPTTKTIEKSLTEELDNLLQDNILQDDELYEQVQEKVLYILQMYGYYDAVVRVNYDGKQIAIDITLNQPITIRQYNLELTGAGYLDPAFKDLKQYSLIQSGDIFEHRKYEASKDVMIAKVQDNGYLRADFSEHKVEVDLEQHSADIYITIDTQDLHYFGQTTFNNQCFNERFLKRFIPYSSQERYATDQLLELQDGLGRSQYFNNIEVNPVIDENRNIVDVAVKLEPAKPNHYQLGVGYGTDTKARGLARWNRRYVNRMGHKFSTGINYAEKSHTFDAIYTMPGKKPATDSLKFRVAYQDEKFDDKSARKFEGEIKQNRQIYSWQRIMSLIYLNEEDDNLLLEGKRHTIWILPSIGLKKVISDDPLNPTHGKTMFFNLKGGYETSDSNKGFIQPYAEFKWLHAVSPKTSWFFRGELGATIPDDAERLPLSQRFYAGGDNSIRGFGYRTLPTQIDDDGVKQPVGGGYLAVASLEGRYLVKDPLGIHAFVDAGNAFRDSHDRVEVGVGAGIHYRTRLGPLKASLAQPLTKGASSLRLHVQFGAEL